MDLILLRNIAHGASGFIESEYGSCRDCRDVLQPDGGPTGGVQDACGLVEVGADASELTAGVHQLEQDGAPRRGAGGGAPVAMARAAAAA